MIDKIVNASVILFVPCLVISGLFSVLLTLGFVRTEGDEKSGPSNNIGCFVLLWPIVGLISFIIAMAAGLLLFGGFALIKSLWNAA